MLLLGEFPPSNVICEWFSWKLIKKSVQTIHRSVSRKCKIIEIIAILTSKKAKKQKQHGEIIERDSPEDKRGAGKQEKGEGCWGEFCTSPSPPKYPRRKQQSSPGHSATKDV